jgi:hypothetical protein
MLEIVKEPSMLIKGNMLLRLTKAIQKDWKHNPIRIGASFKLGGYSVFSLSMLWSLPDSFSGMSSRFEQTSSRQSLKLKLSAMKQEFDSPSSYSNCGGHEILLVVKHPIWNAVWVFVAAK